MTDCTERAAPPERLSETLRHLLDAAKGRGLRVREMVDILQGRGLQMVIVLLSLPFLSPVAIPGLSLPFGLAIALSGLRVALKRKPWLPRFIMERHVSQPALERMVRIGRAVYGKIEKLARPRLLVVVESAGMHVVIGLSIALSGFLLSLPIPPPFPLTNTIPGLAVILLSLGLIERDGVLLVAGYGVVALAVTYFVAIAFLGAAGLGHAWQFVTGG